MPAVGLIDRQKAMTATGPEKDGALWDWQVRRDGAAVLTMPGWAVWNSKWDWKSWLDDRLDNLAGSKGLIVDLRDNEGGADCGDAILARLITKTYVPSAWQQRLRFRRSPAELDKYLDTWDDSFRSLGINAKPLEDGFYLRPAADDLLAIEPSPKRLGVPMVVLTSPVNSSATFQFASNVRALGAGRLVGGRTGGNQRGINGGCFFFVRLPGSGLEFDLPLVGYFATHRQPDAGLIPDYEVMTTSRDLAAGRDPILERAAALVI
jgi:C-terminal processing protease CtpA/Prc